MGAPERARQALRKRLADMTDVEFERWLKRNRITGVGAFNVSMARRAQQASDAAPSGGIEGAAGDGVTDDTAAVRAAWNGALDTQRAGDTLRA